MIKRECIFVPDRHHAVVARFTDSPEIFRCAWSFAPPPGFTLSPASRVLRPETRMNEAQAQSNPALRIAWRAGYLLAAIGIYLTDQVTKTWAVRTLRVTSELTIIRGLLDFIYTENPGIAFGQLQRLGPFGRWFLAGLAIIAALVVLFYF